MKKLLTIATSLFFIASANSFAKTEGNYAGINLIRTNAEYVDINGLNKEDNNVSFGIDYKYAFNYNGLFLAPGIFYNDNDVIAKSVWNSGGVTDTNHLRYSYGFKLEAGYDINNKISLFGIVGHSENRINFSRVSASAGYLRRFDSTREAFIYGLGAKYSLSDNLDLVAAYELSQYSKSDDVFNDTDNLNSDYEVARIGLSFNF